MGNFGNITMEELDASLQEAIKNGCVAFMERYVKITETTTNIQVPLPYNKATDCLFVYINNNGENRPLIRDKDFIVSDDSGYIYKADETDFYATNDEPMVISFKLFKAVPADQVKIDGKIIMEGTLPATAIDNTFVTNILNDVWEEIEKIHDKDDEQDRRLGDIEIIIQMLNGGLGNGIIENFENKEDYEIIHGLLNEKQKRVELDDTTFIKAIGFSFE